MTSVATALVAAVCLVPLRAATTRSPKTGPQPEASGWAAIHVPLFLESGDYRSILTLNNNRPEPIQVEVETFGPGGEGTAPVAVVIPAMTTIERPLAGLLRRPVPFGSLEVRYEGMPLEATAQVTVSSALRRVSFESPETRPAQSRRLDAILRLPDDNARATVALTNLSDDPLTATLAGTGPASPRVVPLRARQTRLIEASGFAGTSRGVDAAVLLSVEHDGGIGGLAATGFVLDERTGFSSTITFSDPAAARSSRLAATDFRFGPPAPGEGFPPSVSFQATLTLANRGDSPLEATVFVNYAKGGVKGRVEAAGVDLNPSEVRSLNLNEALAGLGIAGPIREAGLDIVHDGPPGALLAELASRDASGDYSRDYPVKDPEEAVHTGGSYPWRLDGGRRTVVHLKNATGQAEWAFPQIRWAGGLYTPEAVHLDPWESVSLDLEELRASGEPDLVGVTLPPEAESGQFVWYAERHGALIGRAEVSDDEMGVASGFSCEPLCCGLQRYTNYMSPGSFVDVVGNEGNPFSPKETRRDCHGTLFGPYDISGQSQWASSDTSVATVSGGHVTCLSAGTTGITASFSSIVGYASYPSFCYAITAPGTAGGSMTVNEPTLMGPSSVTRGGNATFTILNTNATAQISAWNFSSSSLGTINRPSGGPSTSWSGTLVTDGTIGVTVVQGGQTYNLSRLVTVNPRSGFSFAAVSAAKVANGSSPFLTIPAVPVPGDESGRFELAQDFNVSVTTVSGGPNNGLHYVQSISNSTGYEWIIASAAEDQTSPFFLAQCGDYDAQQNPNGFISGAQLRDNIIHHESNSSSNSHYHNYRVSQDNQSNNVGLAAESQVGPPSIPQTTFRDVVVSLLMQSQMTIGTDATVEPCQGLSNYNHAGNCEYQGNVNYPNPTYQPCQ